MEKKPKVLLTAFVILIAIGFVFSICNFAIASDTKTSTLKRGKVFQKQISGVTFHTYTASGMVSHIVETKNYLIVQDTVQSGPDNEELKLFIQSLKKPVNRIIISHAHAHHWVGLEMFPDVPVYANAATSKEIQEKGSQMVQGLKKRFGEGAIPYKRVVVPQYIIEPGEDRIDGVPFRFKSPSQPYMHGVLWTELPEQRAIMIHHLAYVGTHFPPPPIQPRMEMLKELKAKSYNWIMAGHGTPMGPDFFNKAMAYYETVQKVVEQSSDAKTAKAKLIKAYPNYGGVFLLDMMLPPYFKKK